MPDVSRSDSNRSDSSRPRVSFNRDVHVKRINGPRVASAYSLTPDGTGLAPTAVRRERPKTKKQMTKEAEDVLKQVDKFNCIVDKPNNLIKSKKPKRRDSFLSFRSKEKPKNSSSEQDSASSNEKDNKKVNNFMSLDRKKLRRDKKNKNLEYLSIDETARKENPKVNCNVNDDKLNKRKQLSPIIESPVVVYPEVKKENNIDKMIKKLTERTPPRLDKSVGPGVVQVPGVETCHNDNKPFSYLNGSVDDLTEHQAGRNLGGSPGSPMADVIYAQVVVSGRDGSARKKTVHTRVSPSVGSQPNVSQVGIDCADGDGDMWRPRDELYGENPGRRDLYRRKSVDSDRDVKTPSPFFDCGYKTRVRVEPLAPSRRSRSYDTSSPTNLHDLSVRRQILLSRSESQAKERYNSLKRISEPPQRQVNGLRNNTKPRYLGNDTIANDKFSSSLRKSTKDVDQPHSRRESKLEGHGQLKTKNEEWKQNEKLHTARNDNTLLQRLSRLGKSKSFIEDSRQRMDKMKLLFRKKKDSKGSGSDDDVLTSRYTEYRGSDLELSDTGARRNNLYSDSEAEYGGRKRLPTPSSSRNSYDSSNMTTIKNNRNKESNWFKSLDRLKKKTSRYRSKNGSNASELSTSSKPSNLRFFGDTDQESVTTECENPALGHLKLRYGLDRGVITESEEETLLPSRSESRMTDSTVKGSTTRYKSRYDLDRPDYGLKQMNHGLNVNSNKYDYNSSNLSDTSTIKNSNYDFNLNGMKYGPNVSRSPSSLTNSSRYEIKESLRPLRSTPSITVTKPTDSLSRRVKSKSQGNLYGSDYSNNSRRRFYDSSAESTTEGDSGHSTKSMVYLHAATVGDIPGHKSVYRGDSRSRSREELSSIGETSVLGNRRTLSRSISVLAPWRPKHYKQDTSLHYDSGNGSDFGRGKPPTGLSRSQSKERKPNELRFNTLGKENRRQKDLLR